MSINADKLGADLIDAATKSLGASFQSARAVAEPQLRALASLSATIAQQVVNGELSAAEAEALLKIHLNTTKVVLLAIEGLGLLAVEAAVNAVTGVIRDTANTAVGFPLV
ncbi:MAG: hypothetical protein ACREMA_08120 [Longimicrobiales bacterium]